MSKQQQNQNHAPYSGDLDDEATKLLEKALSSFDGIILGELTHSSIINPPVLIPTKSSLCVCCWFTHKISDHKNNTHTKAHSIIICQTHARLLLIVQVITAIPRAPATWFQQPRRCRLRFSSAKTSPRHHRPTKKRSESSIRGSRTSCP